MKAKMLKTIGIIAFLAMIGLTLACNNDNGGGGGEQFTVSGADFEAKLKEIRIVPGTYTITLTSDVTDFPGISLDSAGVNLTVKGNTEYRKITWKRPEEGGSHLFLVGTGNTLTLENITLERGNNTSMGWALLVVRGGTLEIKNGVTMSNTFGGADGGSGVSLDRAGSVFTMSGGTIKDCGTAINSGGTVSDISIAITGGTIRDILWHGVALWNECSNSRLTVSGGTLTGIGDNAIVVGGSGHTVNISGGKITANDRGMLITNEGRSNNFNISGGEFVDNTYHGMEIRGSANDINISNGKFNENGERGIQINSSTTDNVLTISGGEISSNGYAGMLIEGAGHTITMRGGTIRGNNTHGININDSAANGVTINMSGGTISGNRNWGLIVGGPGSELIKTGGTIYGINADSNANGDGAIRVPYNGGELAVRYGNATGNYSAKINATKDGIASRQGNWD